MPTRYVRKYERNVWRVLIACTVIFHLHVGINFAGNLPWGEWDRWYKTKVVSGAIGYLFSIYILVRWSHLYWNFPSASFDAFGHNPDSQYWKELVREIRSGSRSLEDAAVAIGEEHHQEEVVTLDRLRFGRMLLAEITLPSPGSEKEIRN